MSWPMVSFLSVCDFQGGTQPPKSTFIGAEEDGYIRLLQIQDFKRSDKKVFIPLKKTLKTCQKNDILIARYGASIGKILTGLAGAYNVALTKTIPDLGVLDKKYLYYFLVSEKFQGFLKSVGTRAAQAGFNKDDFSNLEIPLPPLETQKKIAAVLEKADQLRKDCQQMEQELNSLAQSVFIDMFGDPVTNPKRWEAKTLNKIAKVQLGKMLSSKSKQNINPKKYLRNANVQWRKIGLEDLLEMDFNDREMTKFRLIKGDLLVCEGGEIGRCAIWSGSITDCYYQKALHRVRIDNKFATPEYIQEYFFWMAKLGGLVQSTNEVTFKHLTAEKMNKLEVPLPPICKQQKFSEIYYSILKELTNNSDLSKQAGMAFNSLMQKAFKGELNL